MERRKVNRKRTLIIAAMAAAAVLIFAGTAFFFVQKRSSPEYILRNADGSEYINISGFGDKGIEAMSGKNVGELDLSGGDYTSLAGLKNVSAKTVNVSDIGAGVALWPVAQMDGIETIKISQDQKTFARDFSNSGINVEIVH